MNNTITLVKKNINLNLTKYLSYVPISLLGFFIPNIIISKTINPLIAVYLSAFLHPSSKNFKYKFYLNTFFIGLGAIYSNTNQILFKNLFIIFIMSGINLVISKKNFKPNNFNKAIISSLCIFLSNLLLIYFYSLNFTFLITTLFESSLTFILSLILYRGILLLDFSKMKQLIRLTTNETISLILFLSMLMFAMENVYIGFINLQLTFFTILVLFISYNFGSSKSILVSFIFIFITGILTRTISFDFGFMLLFSSALAGLPRSAKNKGKFLTVFGFLLGIASMYTYYFYYNIDVFEFKLVFLNFAISSLLFLLIPEFISDLTYKSLSNLISSEDVEVNYLEIIQNKFDEQTLILDKLSNIFKIQYNSLKENNESIGCSTCNSLNLRLLEANYLLYNQCNHFKENILDTISSFNNTYKYDYQYLKQDKIKTLLKISNIATESVNVFVNEKGKYEVLIKKHKFSTFAKSDQITKIIKEVIPVNMYLDSEKDNTLHYIESYKFNVMHSIATLKKENNELSGDTFSVIQNKYGEIIFTLCDGMGSGDLANKFSTTTIELFEDLVSANFDKRDAIKLVNSMLLIKENKEFFSSLDCCSIDKYTGVLSTYKAGASSTYILRNNKIEAITSKTLPIGILSDVDIDYQDMQLNPGDVIIMMTDGVIDGNYEVSDKENWLANKLSKCNKKTPEGIAKFLLDETKSEYRGEPKDDCTILVSKVWTTQYI